MTFQCTKDLEGDVCPGHLRVDVLVCGFWADPSGGSLWEMGRRDGDRRVLTREEGRVRRGCRWFSHPRTGTGPADREEPQGKGGCDRQKDRRDHV